MERSDRLVMNTSILGIGIIFSKLLIFIMIPFFSRWLSPEDYGTFDVFAISISLLIPFITLSCGEAVFRLAVETDEVYEQKRIISNGFVVVLIGLSIALCTVAVFFAIYQPEFLMPFIIYLAAEVFNHYLLAYLRGLKKLKIFAISNFIYMMSVAIFVTIFVYFLEFGLKGIVYGYATASVCSIIFIIVTTRFYNYISVSLFDFEKIKQMLKYSAPLIPNHISWWIVNVSDRLIISAFLGLAFNGIYAIANKIPSICTVLFSVFHVSWQQSVSEAMNDEDREMYFNQVLNTIIPVLVTVCICVLSLNFILFDYIFDAKYAQGYYQVPILIAAVIFTAVSQFFGGIFIGMKETKKNGSTTVISALINIILNLLLVKVIGLYAASISTLISFVALCIIRYFFINKTYKLRFSNKTLFLLLIFAYFVVMQYINITVVNYINIVLAITIFFIVNWLMLVRYVKKILKRAKPAEVGC